jgi:hypothetical protein
VVVALVAVLIGGAVVVWVSQDDVQSSVSQEDCALVEDLGHQWESAQAAVRQAVEQSSDYLTAAEREATMAETLRNAAELASSQEVRDQLEKWAHGADLFAQTQRDVAEREPGTPPASNAESDFITASTEISDASIALGDLCPNMPWEEF